MCNVCKNTGKISLTELVNEIFINKGDIPRREYIKYKNIAKSVYRELNLFHIKEAYRVFISVDKETNSIKMPENMISFSSICVIDDCGKLVPIYFNELIDNQDIVDIGSDKKCRCTECNCQNADCGSVYKYETISETVSMAVPEGGFEDFTRTVIKRLDPDGTIVQEISEPTLIFDEEGVHTSTENVLRLETLCKLSLRPCGCVDNTEENSTLLASCSCSLEYSIESGSCNVDYSCSTKSTYSMNEERTRMYFDTKFNYDKVLLRYYANEKNSETEIPLLAKDAVMFGTEYRARLWDPSSAIGRTRDMKDEYERAASDMASMIYRMTDREFINTLTPPRIAPSH